MRTIIWALVLLGGCATAGGRLGGGEWRVVNINGVPVLAGDPVTLRLENGGLASGGSGCNSYSGGYSLSSREGIAFSAISGTERGCEAAIMEQERRYLAILRNVRSYSLYGDGSLSLIAADGSAIRYRMSGR